MTSNTTRLPPGESHPSPPPKTLPIVEAQASEIQSLSTILARAFHPTNPYIKRCYPDTALMRQWWTEIFTDIISKPECHVVTCIQPEPPSSRSATRAVGVLIFRLLSPEERGAGFWTDHAMTPDHDVPACKKMIDGMVESRERMMLGRIHFVIEMFAVESDNQGGGIGGKLIAKACKIADEAGFETFVQANHFARKFYERYGFACKETKTMPGDEGYVECMLVRPAGGSKQG